MNLITKRLSNELKYLVNNPIENCSAKLMNDDPKTGSILEWCATIIGPVDTPYENGIFHLEIKFTNDYPCKPPKVKFITPIYHCNINKIGDICLDILKDRWSPVLNINKLLLSICSLLAQPNPDDPLEHDIANLYKQNKDLHNYKAKEYTHLYAMI